MKKTHLTSEDLADFFAELYILRQAQIPEKEALQIMAEGQEKKAVQQFLTALINTSDLLSGLEQFSAFVPAYIMALLHHARKNNAEIKVLADIAEHLNDLTIADTSDAYRQKLKNSLVYPAVILLMVFILATIMLIFVMPAFADMFKSFGTELPALTQLLINISVYVQQYIGLILMLTLALVVYFNSRYSHQFKSKLLLQLPVVGRAVGWIESAAILKTLHLLCSYQFSLSQALRLSVSATQNTVIITALTESADKIVQGGELMASLQPVGIFSVKTRRLLALFAKTQQLQILQNLAGYHDKQIPAQTALSLQLLNVLLLLSCWLMVGAMVIAVYLPIFALGAAVG
jgi:type IV pilus assembly protein PilC